MNPLAKILTYVCVIVLVAALLSPPIYWGAQALAAHGILPALAEFPFFRFFSRILQIAALVLLWPVIRWLQIRSVAELGLQRNPRGWRDLGVGLATALAPLIVLGVAYYACEIYKPSNDFRWVKLLRVFGTAAVVGVVEEFLFRGVLLGLGVRYLGKIPGLFAISAIFSIVHFLKPRAEITDVHWWSGFSLLGSALDSQDGPAILIAGAIALFVIGLILGWVTLRTHSLWLAIGLHAGWVLGQQTINTIGRYRVKPPDSLLPWVGPNVVSGMVPTGLIPLTALLVTAALLWWYLPRGPRAHPSSGD